MYHVCYTLVLLPHSKAAGTQHINGPNFNVKRAPDITVYFCHTSNTFTEPESAQYKLISCLYIYYLLWHVAQDKWIMLTMNHD